ncbi:MAG TPA: CapA family protein [Dermatophilaceae bacterium]|nr:CapA family protein [Dermatophilaceae bacterium]
MPSTRARRRVTLAAGGLVLVLGAAAVSVVVHRDAPPPPPVTIAFAGDVHFAPPLAGRLAKDPATALGTHAASTLGAADVAMVNLETAVTEGGGRPAPKQFTFTAPPTAFEALRGAGVDVTTMANNHGLDHGASQVPVAVRAAREAGVALVGIGRDEDAAYAPAWFTLRGQRVAVLSATSVLDDEVRDAWTAGPGKPGLASAKRVDRLRQAVRAAREDADLVVVYLHWGRELVTCPAPAQRELQGALVGAGADVVVGSHAHALLGGGWTSTGAYVDYGLGNFGFYAKREVTTQSGVLVLTARGRQVTDARWVPARIRAGVPRAPSAEDAAAIGTAKAGLRECADLRAEPPSPGRRTGGAPALPCEDGAVANAPAAGHALDVLELLARRGEPVPAAAIARDLGLPRSTVYHLLSLLRDRGYVSHLEAERRFGLGLAAYELGAAYQRSAPLERMSRATLDRLVDASGHNAHLAVLHGRDVLYVIEQRAPRRPHLVTDVGVRLPATLTATGLAMLAALPAAQVRALFPSADALVRRDGRGPDTPLRLKEVLTGVRRRGYALEDGLVTPGLRSVAVALADHTGHPLAAVAVTFPADEVDAAAEAALAALVTGAVRSLRRRLGGAP